MIMMALLAAALYVWLVVAGGRAQARLQASVTALRQQDVSLQQQAGELQQLRANVPKASSQTAIRSLVQAGIDAAGLSAALVKIDAADANQVTVVFGAIVFADWLHLLVSLKAQQIRLDACRVEAMPTPGMVNVTATLLRPHQP